MRKLVVSEWISLDGVFDAHTMPQWYMPFDSKDRQDYIRDGIMAADAFLFGRHTYEMLYPYWSRLNDHEMGGVAGKLNNALKYVISATIKGTEWNNSIVIRESVLEEVKKLKQQPGSEIQIEGSATLVQALAKAGLVDEYRFLVHPIIAGQGIRFFREDMNTIELKLMQTQQLDKGVLVLYYQPDK